MLLRWQLLNLLILQRWLMQAGCTVWATSWVVTD